MCVWIYVSVCGPDLSSNPGCGKAKVSLALQLTPLCCRLSVCACVCGLYVSMLLSIDVYVCVCMHTCVLCLWTCVQACQFAIEGEESWKILVSVSVDVLQTPSALQRLLPVARTNSGYDWSEPTSTRCLLISLIPLLLMHSENCTGLCFI